MKSISNPPSSSANVWAIGVRFGHGGPSHLLLLYLGLVLLPLLGYFVWDLFDGGIGELTPSSYLGVVVDAIVEELAFRLAIPAIVGWLMWLVLGRKKIDTIIAACLWVATLAWVLAHPLQGQPWSKLVELVPASVFYAILWQGAFDEMLVRARGLRMVGGSAISISGARFLLSTVRLGLLAIVAHSATNVLAELMWRQATSG